MSEWCGLVPPVAVLVSCLAASAGAQVQVDLDPESGLKRWHFREDALSVELVRRLPDQTRGFFMGRGFDAASADRFARACVFQAIVRNRAEPGSGGPVVAIDLARWRVDPGDGSRPLPLEAGWQEHWAAAGQTTAARVAFRWALFPTRQAFQPGDYNWGMIALGAQLGQTVDVLVAWQEDGQDRQGRIADVRCPIDE